MKDSNQEAGSLKIKISYIKNKQFAKNELLYGSQEKCHERNVSDVTNTNFRSPQLFALKNPTEQQSHRRLVVGNDKAEFMPANSRNSIGVRSGYTTGSTNQSKIH